jgi:hypothetical protein
MLINILTQCVYALSDDWIMLQNGAPIGQVDSMVLLCQLQSKVGPVDTKKKNSSS